MAAPAGWYGPVAAGEDDLALPASGVPNPSVEGKELEQPLDPWWEVGIYIGTSPVNFGSHFVFLGRDTLPQVSCWRLRRVRSRRATFLSLKYYPTFHAVFPDSTFVVNAVGNPVKPFRLKLQVKFESDVSISGKHLIAESS